MNIIERNFFRVLRVGAFGDREQVEPMSAWKWRQLLSRGAQLGLTPLLADGIDACSDQFFMQLPADELTMLQEGRQKAENAYEQDSGHVAALLATLGEQQLRPIMLASWAVGTLYPLPSHRQQEPVVVYFPFATQGRKADEWAAAAGSNVAAYSSVGEKR